MRRAIVLIVLSLCVVLLTVFSTASSSISATIANHTVQINGKEVNKGLENPLLSYENRTYISIRDIAKAFNKDVLWYNEEKVIMLKDRAYSGNSVLWDYDTAKMIGKAIICQYFPDEINDNTLYAVSMLTADHIGAKKLFIVEALFNLDGSFDEISYNADAFVEIDSNTGEIVSVKRRGDEQWIDIFPVTQE